MSGLKYLSDPVHNFITLTEPELHLIQAKSFQRLRSIKQLGLANYVYPAADYSRLSHSLGVCHLTGLFLENLKNEAGATISQDEISRYRIAALLHDIGHYPFSHAMEFSIKKFYSTKMLVPRTSKERTINEEYEKFYLHERVGKEILRSDGEIVKILHKHKIDPEEIYSIFLREKPLRFRNLISSDLDADRIDFLLRTSHHTGLPYGALDVMYLLSQVRLDLDGRICIHPKALRTADHFLLARYFDYQSVAYHKTVAGLELVLKDIIAVLLESGKVQCGATDVRKLIRSGEWIHFDDARIFQAIFNLKKATKISSLKLRTCAVLERIPPKLLVEYEEFALRNPASVQSFRMKKNRVDERIRDWAKRFGIKEDLWYLWQLPGQALTKIGSRIPMSTLENQDEILNDEYDQSIRVFDPVTQKSKPITETDYSLMKLLSEQALFSLKLFILFPPDKIHLRSKIREYIKEDLKDEITWK